MTSASKLLERMRQSKYGWSQDDLHRVYLAHGFVFRAGAKHSVYVHPEFPELRATVARHGELPPGYVQHALKLIEKLKALRDDNP